PRIGIRRSISNNQIFVRSICVRPLHLAVNGHLIQIITSFRLTFGLTLCFFASCARHARLHIHISPGSVQRVSRTGALRLEAHLLGHIGKVCLFVAVFFQQIVQIFVFPHGGEHMGRILDNLNGKMLSIPSDVNHSLDTSLMVARLDKVVVAFDALVDAGERGGDGVLVENAESEGQRSVRVWQLGNQIFHGILSNQLPIFGVNGQVSERNRGHTNNGLVLVLVGLEQVDQSGQALEPAYLLANDHRGPPVARGQILQAAHGRLDGVAHRALFDDDQVLVECAERPEELLGLAFVGHCHVVRIDRVEELFLEVFALLARRRAHTLHCLFVARERLHVPVIVWVHYFLQTK
ncbi:hypothetical protein BpHYR1_008738, partial [Brachionus plicatilis]